MSKFVRSSKYRHVFGQPYKKEDCFDEVRITRNAHDGNFCAANEKYVAVVVEASGGGAFLVYPKGSSGKCTPDTPRVTGHKGAVFDVAWNPFNPNMIASCSEDCTVKVWMIPEGGLQENMEVPALTLNGHQKKVGNVYWHPTCENVLFSLGYDLTLRAWDVSTGEQINSYIGHKDSIYSLSFNEDGSKFVTTCKDTKIRMYNSATAELLFEKECHQGFKANRAVWLLGHNKIFTVGSNKRSTREYYIYDAENLAKLNETTIDSASGTFMAFFDPDCSLLYLAAKGEGKISYYEVTNEAPYVFPLSAYTSNGPQRGLGFSPKYACNVGACEIGLFYKLHPTNLVEPISMIVPRKSDLFQDDIFPDTGGVTATGGVAEFKAGNFKKLEKISLATAFVPSASTYVAPKIEEKPASVVDNPKTPKEYEEAYHILRAEVDKLKRELATKEVELLKLRN